MQRVLMVALMTALLAVAAVSAVADDVGGEPVALPQKSAPRDAGRVVVVETEELTYRKNDLDDWKFSVGLYGWFTYMNGDLTVGDNVSDINVDFDNIWKALHMALFADVEVQKGKVGFFTDLSYAKMWTRSEGTLTTIKNDVDWVLLDFGLFYEALELDLGSGSLPPRLRLQPYVGGRYQYFGFDIDVRSSIPLFDRELSPASKRAAPILGMRGFLDFDEHWQLTFAGDGGGFGVDEIQKTWLAELLVGYRFRLEHGDFGVLVGYKGVGVELEKGTGTADLDLIFHGPVLKLAFEF